jgi:glycosyltransferase involved in cell wall biosynthesis
VSHIGGRGLAAQVAAVGPAAGGGQTSPAGMSSLAPLLAAPPRERVLLSTLPPWGGGVSTMTSFVASRLRERGLQPVFAYHKPYSLAPALSVPAFALGRRTVGSNVLRDSEGTEMHEIGAWLPELEFLHYEPTSAWRSLIETCRYHVAVSGNCFPALPYMRLGIPFLSWVATPWRDDRRQREVSFSHLRRIVDATLVRPFAARMERSLLRSGTLLALSEHTRRRLDGLAGGDVVHAVLPCPVEDELFRPDEGRVVPGRIGFTGRLGDPRKNVGLLLEALSACRSRGLPVTAVLVGGDAAWATAEVRRLGLDGSVEVHPPMPRQELPRLLQTLDLYVVPSRQEGLCIAALEAMACGCPVVSTRCGGPEEFVVDGETGYLTGFDAADLAAAIERVIGDRGHREELALGARRTITSRYSEAAATAVFWKAFAAAFGAAAS